MILIRADANEIIGTGHVMRCLSIARALADQGEDILFATADHSGDELIQNNGYKTICLDSPWNEMDKEISTILEVIKMQKIKLMIVDSYYVTRQYFQTLSSSTRLAYIDDMNKTAYAIDYLINYNIYAAHYNYSCYEGTETKLLLHPSFAPLREEFRRMSAHPIRTHVHDVLVSAGGADPEHISEKILSCICPELGNIKFHVLVGLLNPRIREIRTLAEKSKNVILHVNEQHMSELMTICDIAIAAAGTTLYELCATGLPTITYTLADNQIVATEQFEAQGIMLSAGDCRCDESFIDRVKVYLKEMCNDIELRRELSSKMQTLVDGNGAERIAKELLSKL